MLVELDASCSSRPRRGLGARGSGAAVVVSVAAPRCAHERGTLLVGEASRVGVSDTLPDAPSLAAVSHEDDGWPDGWPKKAGGALPSRDELKAASERLVNPLGRQKLSREERQQRTAERLAKQPTPTDVYGGGRRAGARAQPVLKSL